MNQSVLAGLGSLSLLDAAYEEYCRRLDAQDSLSAETFLRRFPAIQSSLARLIELHHSPEAAGLAPPRWPSVGETFLGFRLESILGRGAFSHVFLATQPALGNREVAVKITTRGSSEAFTLGRVSHPNITPIHSVAYDADTGLSAICMPYVGHATLLSVLDRMHAEKDTPADGGLIAAVATAARGNLPGGEATVPRKRSLPPYESTVRQLFADLCNALALLHDAGIVHQDLKPSNVLLAHGGAPVLLDFNLAADSVAKTGNLGGTVLYMSPEQLAALQGKHEAVLGVQSDLYSLGVMFWEVLTGEHPFGPLRGEIATPKLAAVLAERQKRGFVPSPPAMKKAGRFAASLTKSLLEFDPTRRPSSARAAQELFAPRRSVRSKRLLWAVAGGVLAASVAGAVLISPFWGTGPSAARATPRSGWDAYRDGVEKLKVAKAREAVESFSEAIRLLPSEPKTWIGRSCALTKAPDRTAADLANALSDVQSASSLHADPESMALQGYVGQLMGQPALAEHCYRKCLPLNLPTAPEVQNNLGALISDRFPDEAIAILDQALIARPESATIWYNRGIARYLRSTATLQPALDAEEKELLRKGAAADFRKAIELDPASSEPHYHLAKTLAFPSVLPGTVAEEVYVHLGEFVKLGGEASRLQDLALKALRTEERFQELVRSSNARAPHVAKFQRLLDPYSPLLLVASSR